MQVNPYLLFDGQCEAALNFYSQCFGGGMIKSMKYGKQNGCGAGFEDKIMHAAMQIGDTLVLASDCPPGRYAKPQGFSVAVNLEQPEQAERVFSQLAEDGEITMPIAETFWAQRFGMLVDRFGTPWMIGCNKQEYAG